MKRSGSTLHYQLTKEIVESSNAGKALGTIDPVYFKHFQEKHPNKDEFLIIKCHDFIDEARDLFSSNRAKAIYVYRDIRDVVVSIMNKNKLSFINVLQSGFIRSLIEEYAKWKSLNGILVSKYEIMITDLMKEAIKIADYLEITLDESTARKIAEKYTIDRQILRVQNFDYDNNGIESGANMYDPVSLLHKNHMYSGKPEHWKTTLSRFEVALIENMAGNWLIGENYLVSQNWIIRKAASASFKFLIAPKFVSRYTRKILSY
jgi:hypothetical protein